ncbi:MAG: paraquat-inducible protein A [Pseudomonadota bacterium]
MSGRADNAATSGYPSGTAAAAGLQSCARCGRLAPATQARCALCGKRLSLRVEHSLQQTLALLVTSVVLFVPAYSLPIMRTVQFGSSNDSTILGGVLLLMHHGSYPTALVIFVASVMVPIAKIIALTWLVWGVARGSAWGPRRRQRLYGVVEFVGRWSMVDVFVVALLVALVQITGVLTIQPGSAALSFCGMVVATMLAADAFDTRLIWDRVADTPAANLRTQEAR